MFLDLLQHSLGCHAQQSLVGQAELGAVMGSLAGDQRVVLGMGGKVFLGRDHRVKHQRIIADRASG